MSGPDDPGNVPGPLSVSAGVGDGASFSMNLNKRSFQVESMSDEQYYKDNRKAANRGNLRHELTPKSFVLDIDSLVLYNEIGEDEYENVKLLEWITAPNGAVIPRHIDLAFADDFIRNINIDATIYHGLCVKFEGMGNGGSNNGYYVRSITGIDLPSEYDGIPLNGEETAIAGLPADLRYFGFNELQPFENFPGWLIIGSNVEEKGIQNPLGENGTWINPIISSTGNSVSLYYSTDSDIVFSPYRIPNTFSSGDVISASGMNANFNAVETAVNNLMPFDVYTYDIGSWDITNFITDEMDFPDWTGFN